MHTLNPSDLAYVTPSDTPDYDDLVGPISSVVWSEFMHHDRIAQDHWDDLYDKFPQYQRAYLDPVTNFTVGFLNSVPLSWMGHPDSLPAGGWDWAMVQSVRDHAAALQSKTLCAIQIAIHPSYQRQGLSGYLLSEMRQLALSNNLIQLVAPVRPSLKFRYPLTQMDSYIRWQDETGLPFDPWLRVHQRAGGKIIKVCPNSMRISGSIQDWETWTDMRFPQSGDYIIPGALVPVHMDLQANQGVYIEPNVWVLHPLR